MQKRDLFRTSQYTVSGRFQKEHYFKNQKNIIKGIAVDPSLPDDFDFISNEERDYEELVNWWDRPFIVTDRWEDEDYDEYAARLTTNGYSGKINNKDEFQSDQEKRKESWLEDFPEGVRYTVRILDGGAWDRSTWKGSFGNLEDALKKALPLDKNSVCLDDCISLDKPK